MTREVILRVMLDIVCGCTQFGGTSRIEGPRAAIGDRISQAKYDANPPRRSTGKAPRTAHAQHEMLEMLEMATITLHRTALQCTSGVFIRAGR